MNRVFIFPGQGSQTVGMGKEFYDTFPIAKETLNLVDSSLNYRLSEIIFNGPDEDLTSTVNAQPALMAVSMAMLNTIMQQSNLKINLLCYSLKVSWIYTTCISTEMINHKSFGNFSFCKCVRNSMCVCGRIISSSNQE